MLLSNLVHALLAEHLEDTVRCEAKRDRAAFLHEEGAIVNDTSFEEALDHEFFAFKLSVHFDDTTLEEVQLISVIASALQLLSFGLCASLQQVDDVIEDGVVIGEVLEVRDLLHRLLHEVEHLVVVLVDTQLDLILNCGLHCNNLLVLVGRKHAKVAVLPSSHSRGCQAVVDNGDFTEKIARSQRLFLSRFLNFLAFLTLRRE